MGLKLDALSVRLGPSLLIQPFSLDIAAGEIVTLMGPSGSGKSMQDLCHEPNRE